MAIQTLLIGPRGHGGEGVYMDTLRRSPPPEVSYDVSGDFFEDAHGAATVRPVQVALNRIVRRASFPDIGFRALRLSQRYDLVHVHAHPTVLLDLNDTPLVLSEGSSSAVYLGDYLGWNYMKMGAAYRRARLLFRALRINDRLVAMQRAQKVYVFSEWARGVNLRWGADPAKLEVVYPGFPTPPAATSPAEGREREQFTFLFVGSDFERKGGYDVVEAFAQVADELPEVRLVLAGFDLAKPNPDLEIHGWASPSRRARVAALLDELVTSGRAVHHPWVDASRLRTELFPQADAFVMPTHAEGFGFTNVEAMSFGLPVISSSVGATPEIVADGRTGRLVPAGDVERVAEAMLGLAADRDTSAAMGDAGRRDFLARFTLERFQAALGDLYRRALEA